MAFTYLNGSIRQVLLFTSGGLGLVLKNLVLFITGVSCGADVLRNECVMEHLKNHYTD